MRRLIGALIVLLVLLTGFGVTAHLLIDRSHLRDSVVAAVERQTGRHLTMGRFSVQVLPWPSVSARDVALSDLPGSGPQPMVHAREVRAAVALTPLLWREIRLENVTIVGGRVTLHRNRAEGANWVFHPEQPRPVRADRSRGPHRVVPHWRLSVGSARLADMAFVWNDEVLTASGHAAIDHAELDGLVSPSPYIDIHGHHDRAPFAVTGHIGPLSVLDGRDVPWSVSLGATLGDDETHRNWVNFDGQIAHVYALRGIAGNLRGEVAALHDLEALFPHANLPRFTTLGGEIGLYDAAPDAKYDRNAGWRDLLKHAGVNHVHFHAETVPEWRGMHVRNVHVDGDTISSALIVSADAEAASHVWHLQGRFGTLEQAGNAWQSALQTALPVSLDVREPGQSGMTATDHRDPNSDGVLNLEGRLAADATALVLKGSAASIAVRDATLHEVKVSGTIEAKGFKTFTFRDMNVESREAAGKATLAVAYETPVRLAGDVTMSRLDLDALQGLWRRRAASVPTGAAPGGAPGLAGLVERAAPPQEAPDAGAPATKEPHPVPSVSSAPATVPVSPFVRRLRRQDADITFAADRVRFNGQDYNELRTHLRLDDGHLILDPMSGKGKDISFAGRVDYDASRDEPVLQVRFSPLLVPASLAQESVGLPLLLRGPMELVGEVRAHGETKDAVLRSAEGHLGVSMVGGTVSSGLLGQYVAREARAVLGNGAIPLRCFGIHAKLTPDHAELDPLGLQAGGLVATGHGDMQIGTQELTLHLVPRVGIAGAGASTPVLVTGTVHAPKVQQEANANGRFELTIGGEEKDICPDVLSAAREGLPGDAPPAAKKRSRASELLHDLGILH